MPENRVSRRDFLTSAAAASAGIRLARAGQTASPSTELLVLMERLLLARTERNRLHEIVVADSEIDFDPHSEALEAAERVVCDIEARMIDFEPRSIADLRLQVELALHQEVIEYGMDERLPRLICERFLRLIPASAALILEPFPF